MIRLSLKCAVGAIALGTIFMIPGCIFSPRGAIDKTISSASFASNEVANMGADATNLLGGTGLAKTAAQQAETTYIDWRVSPYVWDSNSQSYVRWASFSVSGGYQRTRIDTVTFYDGSSNKIQNPTMATVQSMRHIRHVTHSSGGDEASVDFDVTTVLAKGTDTTIVKNGTMVGSYDGEQMATGLIVNVTRKWQSGSWMFPHSGTVEGTFPRYTYTVLFTGSGQATATLTNRLTDKVTITTLTVDQR